MGELHGPAAVSKRASLASSGSATPVLSQHRGRANMLSCDGESLQSILEWKDNADGLSAEDFIERLRQSAPSAKHLSELNLIPMGITADKILLISDKNARQLYADLKQQLAGLMKGDRDGQPSRWDFVDWAEAAADRVPVHVFFPTTCQRYCFYMTQPVTLGALKLKLVAATEVAECDQLLFFCNNLLETFLLSVADDTQWVTTRDRPILLVYTAETLPRLQAPATLAVTPALLPREAGPRHSLCKDEEWAAVVAKSFCCIERNIHENGLILRLLNQVAFSVGLYCQKKIAAIAAKDDKDDHGPGSKYQHLIRRGLGRKRMTVHVREAKKIQAQFKRDLVMQNPSEDQLDFHRAAGFDLKRRVDDVRDLYERSCIKLAQSSTTLEQTTREAFADLTQACFNF